MRTSRRRGRRPGAMRKRPRGPGSHNPQSASAARRGWTIALQVREVGSGAAQREAREKLLQAARRREIDVVLVWRLDRWGRSVTDLLSSLQELEHLGVGFVSLTEALDLTTPAGRAMAGLLAIFADMRSSKRKFCGNELARDWRTPGRTASAWAGPQPLRCTPRRSGNCIAQASAKPKSPASSGLGALPSAESWAIPPRNRSARLRYAGLPKAHDVVVRSHSDMSLANQDYICQTDGLR
jgi:hypothetical protein